MRVAIASRIFAPETSAASIRLMALARELRRSNIDVEVLTTQPPKPLRGISDHLAGLKIRRWSVLRDANDYVRGYLPYLSFDIPLFFRILFGKKADLVIVEPPPTTGLAVRIATWVRRTPYIYYAADIWSDAAGQTGAPSIVLRFVAMLEKWVWSGADCVFSVSEGVTKRLLQLQPNCSVLTIGNGIDTSEFPEKVPSTPASSPVFVYAGTASEWHGALIFVQAFKEIVEEFTDATLVFIGGGSERGDLIKYVHENALQGAVEFHETLSLQELLPFLQKATVSLASLRPGAGYDFAFPTKLLTATAAGTPTLFAGPGPAVEFVQQYVEGEPIGVACNYSLGAVTEAMRNFATHPTSLRRRQVLATWASSNVSIEGPAQTAVGHIQNQFLED